MEFASTRKLYADLHNHSTASDGDYSPTALIEQAKKLKLRIVALTDHDSIDGLKEALTTADAAGIQLVAGVEVSLAFRRPEFTGTLHVLVYFKQSLLKNQKFIQDIESVMQLGRGDALIRSRVTAINEIFGPDGREPQLKSLLHSDDLTVYSANVTRRHFALALKEKHGITDDAVVARIIGNASPAYVPSGIDLEQLKLALKPYPVLRVLAHPAAGSFPGESHYKEVLPPLETVERMLVEFLEFGIQGIEVHYPGHTAEHRQILLNWAEYHGLVTTGGSDCHDAAARPLGVDGLTAEEWVVFERRLNEL
ncbi:PHP domain-containing protein [candidate division KSB1 bacterium]|nr:PHP domain-containing protein [candidate division KSB1 bacterium]